VAVVVVADATTLANISNKAVVVTPNRWIMATKKKNKEYISASGETTLWSCSSKDKVRRHLRGPTRSF
jgi:hypothetical protein